jgi:hypothetical protein
MQWKSSKQDYLFPVAVLSKLFRGKMVAALDQAYRTGWLNVRGVEGFGGGVPDDETWRRLRRKLFRTKWVSYAKAPFAGAESVYQYLGRYTHRVGLSNHRLISLTEDAVTFRTRDEQTATLHPVEFLRRFLLHVLPHGFVKMRHYGLLAPGNVNTKLVVAKTMLKHRALPSGLTLSTALVTSRPAMDWRELLLRLTGRDVTRCQTCGGPISSRALARTPLKDTS